MRARRHADFVGAGGTFFPTQLTVDACSRSLRIAIPVLAFVHLTASCASDLDLSIHLWRERSASGEARFGGPPLKHQSQAIALPSIHSTVCASRAIFARGGGVADNYLRKSIFAQAGLEARLVAIPTGRLTQVPGAPSYVCRCSSPRSLAAPLRLSVITHDRARGAHPAVWLTSCARRPSGLAN